VALAGRGADDRHHRGDGDGPERGALPGVTVEPRARTRRGLGPRPRRMTAATGSSAFRRGRYFR
jgi:hypothetical protein